MDNLKDLDTAISMGLHFQDQIFKEYNGKSEMKHQIDLYLDYLNDTKREKYTYPIGSFVKILSSNGKISTAQIIQHTAWGWDNTRPSYVVRYIKSKTVNDDIRGHQIKGFDTVGYMKYRKKNKGKQK